MRFSAILAVSLLLVAVPLASVMRAAPPGATTLPTSQPSLESESVEKDGLSATVTMAKPAFAADEQPRFAVQFKNVSKKTLSLFDADYFWNWTIHFTKTAGNAPDPGPWRLRNKAIDQSHASRKTQLLGPGEVLEVPVDLGKADSIEFDYDGRMKHLVTPKEHLEPGKYQLVIEISLKENPTIFANGLARHWVGEMTTAPVNFEITALSLQAQQTLDDLNGKMANQAWADEADFFERPGEYPKNRASSGEVPAYLQVAKKRLAELGVQVVWNADTKKYDVTGSPTTQR